MKLWLASYPRSGNTYFRIILDKVYGVPSGENALDKKQSLANKLKKRLFTPVVKTHLLPSQLKSNLSRVPTVYIIRDGRDALVSIAHQRKDIIAPESNYYDNLREAIISAEGSYFGGWSRHVREWEKHWSIVVRFEDLIKNPIECVGELGSVIKLRKPDYDNLPSFEELRNNTAKRISSSVKLSRKNDPDLRKKFFRKGKIGSWKEEMPDDLHQLYWEHHGDMMRKMGYTEGEL